VTAVAKARTATAWADVSVPNQAGGAPESGGGTPEETWNDPGWRRRPGSQQWRRRYSQSGHPTAGQHERPWRRPFCGPRRRRGRAGRQGDGGGKDRQTGDQEQHCGGNPLLNSGFLHGGAVWAVRQHTKTTNDVTWETPVFLKDQLAKFLATAGNFARSTF